ncbi:MAG: efflux RND transporter periplasmic adaptor subunit [Oscillatoriophycideae cyanobacterium NC_groundwater_1537_Pr4_S-0.65um_50_18]|nr:efflux RND transporter periplasmic adaptor subunit [Oscillatoriophycideae cyanobacterium NC_groundwater_1537_Pr4_S-0.65um_50_18]
MKTSESQASESQDSLKNISVHRRWLRSPLVLLTLLLLAGGGVLTWRMLTPASDSPPEMAQGMPPTPVQTAPLRRGKGVQLVQLLGQVEATQSATLRTQTAGIVQQVLVEVGDRVTPGMTIVILDDADQQLALAEAQARLAQERSELARLEVGTRPEIIAQRQAELRAAQAREREAQDNLRRNSELAQEGAISQRLLIEARADADAAQAEQLQTQATLAEATAGPTREEIAAQQASVAAAVSAVNQAQLTLARTQVKAATGGIVRSREVSTGDRVEDNDPVLTLVDSNELDVFLELPEQLSGSITPGLPVELAARALPNWRQRATISGVVPAANATSRRQLVRVELQNPPPNLLPQMAIAGELQLQVAPNSFVVPRDALVQRGETWLVYTVVNGKAAEIKVNLVADMGETVAISGSQLQAGQPVVVRGGEALMDGAPVQIAESTTKQES